MSKMELIDGRFELSQKIGRGSFGTVYQGMNVVTKQPVAIKIEKNNIRHSQLRTESRIYRLLKREEGFPQHHWYGQYDMQNTLVFELLGYSLEQYLRRQGQFSIKTTVMLAQQIFTLIERVHHYGYIHRDIKPENILLGPASKASQVHIIDFGLSKPYVDYQSRKHIRMRTGKKLVGTARYSSLNTHEGIEQSRRDDLESIFYVMLYFLKGSLPWQGIRPKTKQEKYQRIYALKQKHNIGSLWHEYPSEIARIGTYIRSLKFEQEPNYGYINSLLQQVALQADFSFDNIFDWDLPVTLDTNKRLSSKGHKLPKTQITKLKDATQTTQVEESFPKAPRTAMKERKHYNFEKSGSNSARILKDRVVQKDVCTIF